MVFLDSIFSIFLNFFSLLMFWFYLCKITRLIINIFYKCCSFRDSSPFYQRPVYIVWICTCVHSCLTVNKQNQKSCFSTFHSAPWQSLIKYFVIFSLFLFWKVFSNFLCLIFNVTYFELLEHGHPRRLRETEDPGYRQLRQSHARYSTLILQQQCSGSGSTGSTCFWASWIRIRIHTSD